MLQFVAALAVVGVLLAQTQPSPAAQSRRAPATPATLKFGWRPGTVSLVETEYVRKAGADAGLDVSTVRMTHRMRVLAHREGLDVRFEDQQHLDSSGDFRHAADELIHFWTPRTIVSADGTFLRIEGSERVQDLVTATVAPTRRLADALPALREFLAPMLGTNYLTMVQQEEWMKLVWQWIGLSPTQSRLELASSERLPPGVDVPTTRTIEIVERVRCLRAKTLYDCLTIEMRVALDRAAMKSVLDKVFQSAGQLGPRIQPSDYSHVVRVTLETATMLPHVALETHSIHGTADVNGASSTIVESETRRSQFTYE